eukprot:9493790-Pyramimonas_sp.AAC.1
MLVANCGETLRAIALARRRHVVWYASLAALNPNESLGDGLSEGPVDYDYESGQFLLGDLSQEIAWARDLRCGGRVSLGSLTENCTASVWRPVGPRAGCPLEPR